jgi:hypothetical protein
MTQDHTEGTVPTTLHFRFPPPAVGGAQKTGWEALDKWVGTGGAAKPAESAQAAEAAAPVAAAPAAAEAPKSGGGFLGALKRLFGG